MRKKQNNDDLIMKKNGHKIEVYMKVDKKIIAYQKAIKEKDIQKQIMAYLNAQGFWVWRNNSGAFVINENGKKRYFRAGFPGISDIIGIAPDGKFVAIEVKKPGGKATKNQKAFLERVKEMSGYALLAYSLDDVIKFFEK